MNRKVVRALASLVLLACVQSVTASIVRADPSAAGGPRRMALVIGANAAAPGRKALRYARDDAEAVGRVLVELGGFAPSDVNVLLDPDPAAVLRALDAQLERVHAQDREALLLFYYSGHADTTSLYPAGRPLALADLRARLQSPKVSVRIGIIDACRGGGWTGAKGLNETELFEVDLPTALSSEGSVLIASSSGLEDAHESEALGGSFFTHHWIAGLRGAGDRNADGQVMLTEAFEYARALTIRDTALHTASPQHPSFSMQLRGRNDLRLATLHAAGALLSVDQRQGPLELLHLGSGLVVLELPKGERSLQLAVAPGRYLLRRRSGSQVWAEEIAVEPGQTTHIDEERLSLVGSSLLAVKHGAPRPLTLTTVPKGMQEITGWLGVTEGSTLGMNIATDNHFAFGMLAPRGLTDRWQWVLPTLAITYRGGEHGGFEWLPWGGIVGWGMGFNNFAGFILTAQPAFGVDLRRWISQRSSFDFSLGASSGLRWIARDSGDHDVNPQPAQMTAESRLSASPESAYPPRWTPPNTWRVHAAVGYTHTLADTVTFHLALSISQNQLWEGELADQSWRSPEGAVQLAVGSVQSMGLRPQPLIRIHVRDWFALNLDSSVRYHFAHDTLEQTYLGGASFIW
ncbi:MAG: caspase family protein [Myxococcales bacterium]